MERPNYSKLVKEHTVYKLPKKEYVYYAYKNGSIKEFENERDAKLFSKLYEKVIKNEEVYNRCLERYRLQDAVIQSKWLQQVKEYFSEWDEDEINLMYNYACQQESYGYDAVFEFMDEFSCTMKLIKSHYKEKYLP